MMAHVIGRKIVKLLRKNATANVLVVFIIISAIISPHFLQTRNLINILRQVSYTGIIALGMTFVIISGGIDLSVGSLVAFCGLILMLFLNAVLKVFIVPVAITLTIFVSIFIGVCSGFMNGLLVARGKIVSFIATLGGMTIYRSMTLFIGKAGEIRSGTSSFGRIGMGAIFGIPVPVVTMFLIAVLFSILLNNTKYGRHVCAVGANSNVARFSGININRIQIITFTISGLVSGISALLLASRFNAVSTSNLGIGFELDAIAAVIVGGTAMNGGRGTIWGTVFGVIILGILNNMLNIVGVSAYLQGTIKGLIIIGAVLIQQAGTGYRE